MVWFASCTNEGLIFLSTRTLMVMIVEASPMRAPIQPSTDCNILLGCKFRDRVIERVTIANRAKALRTAAPLALPLNDASARSVLCESLIMKIKSVATKATAISPTPGTTNRRHLRAVVETIALICEVTSGSSK
jgi:hypothetical protein